MRSSRALAMCAAWSGVLALGLAPLPTAYAADKVRAGKAIDVIWAMVPVDIGAEEGLFAKYGIDVEISTLTGDAKLQQALVAGSVDIGLAGGTSLVFAAKGSPILGIAAIAGAPSNFSVMTAADSQIENVGDLKGKLISVATNGSFPQWLVKRLSLAQGWGVDGIKTVALGSFEASASATRTHQVDGLMGATEAGYMLEEKHVGRIVAGTGMGQYVPRFHNHVLVARTDFIRDHRDATARFLEGFFAAVAFMKANRAKTIEISSRAMNMSPAVIGKTYDYEIAMLSDDGAFDPEAIKVLKDSFVETGALAERPRDDQLFTTQFLPVKP